MSYNKDTGDVTIHDASSQKKSKKIISSVDEVFKQKQKLFKEVGLDENGMPKDASISEDKLAEKLKRMRTEFINEYEYDPNLFYQFSRDFLRVDVGLIIQRPPIFVRMREKDIDFLKTRQKHMEEFFCDTK